MNSAGRSNISSIFQHGLQDGYLSLNPHVKGGLFPLSQWENVALLFVWILTIKRFMLFQRYNMIPKVQSILYTSQSDSLRKHQSLSCENRSK